MGHSFLRGLTSMALLVSTLILLAIAQANASFSALLEAVDENAMELAVNEAVATAIENEDAINVLETAANEFRSKRLTFSDGEPKLSVFYQHIVMVVGRTEGQTLLEQWSKRFPNSPAPSVIEAVGQLHVNFGNLSYSLIGNVQTQDRHVDQTQLGAVVELLNNAKDLAGSDPYWYVAMARARLILERDDVGFKSMIKEGIAKEPRFFELYDVATDYFLPKWYGSSEALENWTREIADTAPEDLRGAVYARMYWRAFRVNYGMQFFEQSHVDWERFKAGFQTLIEGHRAPAYWSNFAMIACLAGDHEETRRIMKLHSDPPHLDGVYSQDERESCRKWAMKSEWEVWIDDKLAVGWEAVRSLVYNYVGVALPQLAPQN